MWSHLFLNPPCNDSCSHFKTHFISQDRLLVIQTSVNAWHWWHIYSLFIWRKYLIWGISSLELLLSEDELVYILEISTLDVNHMHEFMHRPWKSWLPPRPCWLERIIMDSKALLPKDQHDAKRSTCWSWHSSFTIVFQGNLFRLLLWICKVNMYRANYYIHIHAHIHTFMHFKHTYVCMNRARR